MKSKTTTLTKGYNLTQLAWIGVLISAIVLSFNTVATTKETTIPKTTSIAKTDYVKFIYRGIPVGHKGYNLALDGISKPWGGHNNPELHRGGDVNSNFTSWTIDFTIAYKYATHNLYGPCEGVILMKKVDLSDNRFVDANTMNGGDIYSESEILVKGMMNGCIPILVKPCMAKQDLLKYIKTCLK